MLFTFREQEIYILNLNHSHDLFFLIRGNFIRGREFRNVLYVRVRLVRV